MASWHIEHRWFLPIFLFCAALVVANVGHFVLFRVLRRREIAEPSGLGWGIRRYLEHPARAVFLLTCLLTVLPSIPKLSDDLEPLIRHGLVMALIVSLGWLAVGGLYVVQTAVLSRFDLKVEDNVRARRVHTHFQLFRRLGVVLVATITVGGLLWSFHDDRLWQWGTGLMASAGLASLVLATAAKSTAANLLAGLQIAITEPIKLDDVVIVQGEWGRIEEITTTYVVVRIWDERRLIVPLTYFVENTFQNWTRESGEILGTAFLYVDYSVPVDALRAKLEEVVHGSKLWDGRVCGMLVTNLTEKSMELRCLMSSRNASDNFSLRCHVREELTRYLRESYPAAFPTVRVSALPEGHAAAERV